MESAEVLVVGAGPAGIAAAVRAAEHGKQVVVLDDNPTEGGQIWRGGKTHSGGRQASGWFQKLGSTSAKVLTGSRIIGADTHTRTLHVETLCDSFSIQYEQVAFATGARELFLPFPGWTLPNVMGVGGLQALVKSGLPVRGKRIVIAGSGPLLLAVGAYLKKHGALVTAIVEQAQWGQLLRFGICLAQYPGKLWQAAALKTSLLSTRYLTGSWVKRAEGKEKLQCIQIQAGSQTQNMDCDYLGVAYGFVPNTELPQFLGCHMENGVIAVDHLQRTSLPNVFCAGEVTGLGGVDLSLVEGEIAGYATAGREDLATKLFAKREHSRQFAKQLDQAFALRAELRHLPDQQTLVCRCEDVPFGALRAADSWRAVKLHLRCGMGPCQGRICGPAVEFLLGWKPESIRPPVFPARIGSLISSSIKVEKG